ncbi:MAG: hypothetical protein ABI608_03460, partial [Rhizomicrobium sp.]
MRIVIAVLAMGCAFSQTQIFAATQGEIAKTYAREPDGKGDPGAITCRHPQALAGKRLLGPEVCRTNADWALFAKQGMTVSPDGTTLLPSEKQRSLNPAACGPTAGSAPTTSAMGASRGGM